MISIWGKVTKPAKDSESRDEKFYYSTSVGQIVSSDGSGYVLPDMSDDVVEKTEYVPKEYAQQKLKELVEQSEKTKSLFQQHVVELGNSHRMSMNEAKLKYESVIADMRTKALRHVEVQKQLRQQVEEKLKADLRESEESIEELRDSMAELNREYQEEVRMLKAKLSDVEEKAENYVNLYENLTISSAANEVMQIMISIIEGEQLENMSKEHVTRSTALREQYETQTLTRVQMEQQKAEKQKKEYEEKISIRSETEATLKGMLNQLELNEMKENINRLNALQLKLAEQEQAAQKVAEEAKANFAELQSALQSNEEVSLLAEKHKESLQKASEEFLQEKQILIETHETQTAEQKKAFELTLSRIEQERDQAQVSAALGDLTGLVVERRREEELGLNTLMSENVKGEHAQEMKGLIAKYESDAKKLKDSYEDKMKKIKAKFTGILKDLKTKNQKVEVELCMSSLLLQVCEKHQTDSAATFKKALEAANEAKSNIKKKAQTMLEKAKAKSKSDKEQLNKATAEQKELATQLEQLKKELEETQEKLKNLPTQVAEAKEETPQRTGRPRRVIVGGPVEEQKISSVVVTGGGNDGKNEVLEGLRKEEEQLQQRIKELRTSQATLAETATQLNSDKDFCKNDIKEWTKQFVAENGREPTVQDKAAVKDKYQKYKVLTTKSKETETKMTQAKQDEQQEMAKLADVQQKIEECLKNPGAPSPIKSTIANSSGVYNNAAGQPIIDEGMQTVASEITFGQVQGASGDLMGQLQQYKAAHEEDQEMLDNLEDQLFNVKQELETALTKLLPIEDEKNFLQSQLDNFVKEKRTDIVKRFEEQIATMHKEQLELQEKVSTLSQDKVRHEAKILELRSRAEIAEKELKDRDEAELKKLNPTEEKSQLKTQIGKQRETIILKSKAATAGWDAAAHSDEKLEIDVARAYKKGLTEEKEQHMADMAALNASIEVKENRITELLVQIGEMEKKVRANDQEMLAMKKETESLRHEVADTLAGINNITGEKDLTMGPTQEELDEAVKELDTAQEEIVALMDRIETMEEELDLARTKNQIFERLSIVTGLGEKGFKFSKGEDDADKVYSLDEIVNIVKKCISKCTNLWKSNRKDETYDVYLDCCKEILDKLHTQEMMSPIEYAVNNGTIQGQQNKQRGSVTLRKALDKFLVDAGVGSVLRKGEDEVYSQKKISMEARMASNKRRNEMAESQVMDLMEELKEVNMRKSGPPQPIAEEEEEGEKEESESKKDEKTAEAKDEKAESKDQKPGDKDQTPDEKADEKDQKPDETDKNLDNEELAAPVPGAGGGAAASSLLNRAKKAEKQVESLKKQLAAVIAAQNEIKNPSDAADSKRPTIGRGGADPAEVRKLNRKIKELEEQLQNGGGGGGGGVPGGVDPKAVQQAEKAAQKKLKDKDAAHKRETKALEMRATKAEKELQKIQSTHQSIVAERDRLKNDNMKLFNLGNDVNTFKEKAERFDEIAQAMEKAQSELTTIQEQFKKETALRKKYKNELEDLKGAIRVYARCRPMAKYEIEKGCKQVVTIKDDTSLTVAGSRGDKEFDFDCVFGTKSTQDEVFEDTKRLVESCVDGFNVCLFAYGQTGSGKTFTMTGSKDLPGLTPKAIDELFRLIAEKPHLQVSVSTYFIELYNDNLVDLYWLLDNKAAVANHEMGVEPPKLDIKMDDKKMIFIKGCVIKEVNNPVDLFDLFNAGNTERHVGATKMNAESSRSHSIFAILVESYDKTTRKTTKGKLSLVDLAGSERADKTGAGAERLKEAQSINKSLSALGDVIAALSDGAKFVPYRNNKLTQVMQDSLGGNAKTLMFVNFSPADYNSDETTTSLMYAQRVKKIVNNASKQAESEEVAKLKAIIKKLRGGAAVEEEGEVLEPPPEDDGKVYDGY